MVPTLMCGLVRSNFCFAMDLLLLKDKTRKDAARANKNGTSSRTRFAPISPLLSAGAYDGT
ncbi:hypothetical protein, partial [Chloroflexus sp.]|uniref:hypothetical protein n=1 Tax=Chloroflexus sp. TaxID=1904827 RepID=UPI002FD8F324